MPLSKEELDKYSTPPFKAIPADIVDKMTPEELAYIDSRVYGYTIDTEADKALEELEKMSPVE